MAIVNHIYLFDLPTDINNSLLRGSGYLAYDTSIKYRELEYTDVTPITRTNNWWQLTNSRSVTPLAMVRRKLDLTLLDEATFLHDDPSITFAGGLVLGDFVSAKIPTYNPDNYEHVLSDMIASSIACMIKGYRSRAYSYLRFAQLLISLSEGQKREDTIQSKPVHRPLTAYKL